LNTWTFITVTYDGTTVRMYLNGVLDSSHATGAPSIPAYTKIGARSWITGNFVGSIANVQLSQTGMTDAQVAQLFASSPQPSSSPTAAQSLAPAQPQSSATIASTASSNSSCPTLTQYLQAGSTDATSNNEVSILQRFLTTHFAVTDSIVTGYFGASTQQYVNQFQAEQGISPTTGTVGPATRTAIANACAAPTPTAQQPAAVTTPAPMQATSITQTTGTQTVATSTPVAATSSTSVTQPAVTAIVANTPAPAQPATAPSSNTLTWQGPSDFSGSTQFTLPSPTILAPTFSISAWVKPTGLYQASFGLGIGGSIVDAAENGGAGYALGIRNTNKLWWWPYGGGDMYSNASIPLNAWTFVTVTYDGTTAKMYVNGAFDSSRAVGAPGKPLFTRIGAKSWITGYFVGSMANVQVASSVLTPDQITQLYQTTNPVPAAQPSAQPTVATSTQPQAQTTTSTTQPVQTNAAALASAQSQTTQPATQSAQTQTTQAQTTTQTTGATQTQAQSATQTTAQTSATQTQSSASAPAAAPAPATSIPTPVASWNGPQSFDGSSSVSLSTIALASSFTISAWVNPSDLSARSFGLGIGGSIVDAAENGGAGYALGIRNTNKLWWWPYGGGDMYSNASIPLNAWTFVTVTYDGTTAKMYVNGVLDSSRALRAPGTPAFTKIGARSWITGSFSGSLANLAIYNTALSDANVSALYSATPAPATVSGASQTASVLSAIWDALGRIATLLGK
jgi:hypothetical protein